MRRQAFERGLDPSAELIVHRPLFVTPVGRTAQDHGLAGLGAAGELDLDALAHLAPAGRAGERISKSLQLRLRRTDDVTPTRVA